ncbi:TonB-dependent receptor plug domain-containing protein [Urechidicola croceus]|uniref:TonB-dependent receptor n=1 Tax=Urechidicola croceus TaxID=1850246 RepID=A0A1D8P6I9_9FLAO|nr:TonB-dependent receptor plug domain-containing protein [Urechidicola croceus]AOW20185.1 TonB-dependent receptor [Urechidicola croceus]
MKNKITLKLIVTFFIVFVIKAQGQEVMVDTTKVNQIPEVVITGQYNPQSVKKSVFDVKVITRKDIEQQAGNNLADVLNQALNINIIPNASTGKSGVQLFGLDSQYFKILIDNIPVINDEGLGSNTDLTQLNLDDIEQIEIVEGSMGVEYGANAVSGIINIITKKSSKYKWSITPYIQKETIGNEFNMFTKGRHIQSLKVGHNFNSKLYADVLITANDFKGFWNNRKGKDYTENDGLRGYDWLPKQQLTTKGLLNYKSDRFRAFYKFEYFDEEVKRYDSTVRENYNPATETTNPTSSDEIFTSERFYHHLNFLGKIANQVDYNISMSYQQQKRNAEFYNYRIRQEEKFDVNNFEYESRKGYYSRGTFSNFLKSQTFNFQLGYELSSIKGFSSSLAGTYESDNIERTLDSYDFYASSEINLSDRFSIRPGARILLSSQFDTQAAISLGSRYLFKNGLEARVTVGSAPRVPNYDELYTYFVDVNHDVRGNQNLNPEQGLSTFLHVKKTYWSENNDAKLTSKLSAWYIDVKDKIELTIVNETPLAYQYNNIDTYKTWGTSLKNDFKINQINGGLGATFSGFSKVINSSENYNDDYLYSFQLNANLAYTIPKHDLIFSTYFKVNGPQYLFVQKQNENDETVLVRGKQNGYSWLDASIKKSFLNKALQTTFGVRNILNVNTVNTTATEGGAHSGPPSAIQLGYGRSYFIKVLYKFNFGKNEK